MAGVPAFTWSFADNHQSHYLRYCEMKLWTFWHYELKTALALNKHTVTHKLGIQRVSLCQHRVGKLLR